MARTRMLRTRRTMAWLVSVAFALVLTMVNAAVGQAEPLPAAYGGATSGRVLSLGIDALGLANITAGIGVSTTEVDSTATPRASAASANLAAGALGIPISVASGSATAGPTVGSPTYSTGLGQVDVLPVLDTGVLTGTGLANWAGDAACVPDGTPIVQAVTQLAGATVGIPGINILTLGTVSTTGSTQHSGTSIVSSSSGNLASATLLNGLVNIAVVTNPTITATSTGPTTSVTANAYAIDVTVGGITTRLTAGASLPINLNLGVDSASIVVAVGALSNTSAGTTASGSASFINITGTIDPAIGPALATINTSILPLSASATAPAAGGVECTRLDVPTITAPAEGSTISDTTPAITGNGVPGATLTVNEGASVIGSVTVAGDGTWSLTPATPLTPGAHAITATQSLGVAASDATGPRSFTIVDNVPPAAPVITIPANNSSTTDNTPTISGTGEAGATVTVVRGGGTTVGTATVDAGGTWSLTPTTPLPDGAVTVTATQADPSGNVSPASAPVTFTIDTTAPAAPVITAPADGATLTDNTLTISGTGEPDATVTVNADGAPIGTAIVDAGGAWTLTPTTPLPDGRTTLIATEADAAGNVSVPSAPVTFTIDSTAPAAPVIIAPADGSSTNDTTPTITGTGEPGATVTVNADGAPIGTATVDAGGAWTLTPTTPFAPGAVTLTATQADPAGNVSPLSAPVTFTIDTTAPAAPVIIAPVDGSTTTDNTPTISGTGEPGATVTVTGGGGTPIGTAPVDAAGAWTLTPTTPLPDGPTTITAIQTDPAGNNSPTSAPVTFTIDATAPAAPVITAPVDGSTTTDNTPSISGTGEPGATVTVNAGGTILGSATVDAGGAWTLTPTTPLPDGPTTITAIQADPAGNNSPTSAPVSFTIDATAPAAPVITAPVDGSTTTDNTPTITGTGEPGATVTIDADGTRLGTATVDAGGAWTLTPTTSLPDGQTTLTATEADPAGNVSVPSSPVTFTIDSTPPAAPVITAPADGSTTTDNTPAITGTGEPGATVTVTDSFGAPIGTAPVDAAGAWTLTPTTPLPDGQTTLTATQIDPAGNSSLASAPVTIIIDTTAPAAPAITAPADGSTLTDNTPTITGTGEPGAIVTVTDSVGAQIGTAPVDAGGVWTLTPTTPLPDGQTTLSATQTDPAGNTSVPSSPVTITIDTTVPAAPVITAPADGSTLTDNTPTITGTGEPGDTVTVNADGTPIGTALVDAGGTWSLTPTTPLPDGQSTLTATQTAPAGNVSSPSAPVTITIDTTAPAAPVITSPANGSSTNDTTPTITGTGEPGATVTVNAGATILGSATVVPDGTWTLTPATALPDGPTMITAIQADPAGNVSPTSAPVTFTIDTTAPAAPVITAPADGSTTNDTTPTITGTGEPGATITVVRGTGGTIGTTTVDADGKWQIVPSRALATGLNTVIAVQTDPAGNISPEASVQFRITAQSGVLAFTGANISALVGASLLLLLLGGGFVLVGRTRRHTR